MSSVDEVGLDVVELAKELVAIESVTLREGNVVEHLRQRLADRRFKVLTQPIEGGDSAVKAPRANLLAVDDDLAPIRLVLTTHLDTVPPFIPLRDEGDTLFGRGTCDAKGIFAAQWIAIEILRARGHKGLALLGVVGEETNSIGAKLAHEILPKADWVVDGEPTGLVMTSAAKGILGLKLVADGVAGHSAYPDRGRSATHALIHALHRVLSAELPWHPDFGRTTINVGTMNGGVAPNVIAPEAIADLMIRLGAPLETVKAEIEHLIGPGVAVEVSTGSEPLRIYTPDGYPKAPVSFGSDVPYLSRIGTTLLVGPGSIHDAHTATEKIGKDELTAAVRFYVELGERLLKTPKVPA
ncbi:MAG: M20/M25/M40 family metallo-hydrolase [Myxococcota bacterium]